MEQIDISDEELLYELEKSRRTKNFSNLREISTYWALNNALKRFNFSEDSLSDAALTFYRKFPVYIKSFIRKKHNDYLSFLSIIVKNIFFSIYHKEKKPFLEEYFKLWDRDSIDRAYTENYYSEKNVRELSQYFKNLCPMEKIILSIRYNLELEKKDNEFLNWYLDSKGIESNKFNEMILERAITKKASRQKLLIRINFCNRNLYSNSPIYGEVQSRKEKLVNRVNHTYKMYSLAEISEILDLEYHKVCYYYSKSIRVLKSLFKDEIIPKKAA